MGEPQVSQAAPTEVYRPHQAQGTGAPVSSAIYLLSLRLFGDEPGSLTYNDRTFRARL
jgi:hypothetical protein